MALQLQQMIASTRLLFAFWSFLALAASAAADPPAAPGPWGIDDPGIQYAVLRTEFDDPRIGTAARPLSIDCEASAYPALCADIDTVFQESNSYANRSWQSQGSYWMLTVNNDQSFVERCEAAGPPDQSVPVSAPGAGLAGISVLAETSRNVVHLDVNQQDFANPCGAWAAPFVGFGAYWGRGNSTPIGYLNGEGTVTAFRSRLIGYSNGEGFVYARHYVYAVATWEGMRHMLFIDLFGWDGDASGGLVVPADHGVTSDWKWPYLDSWYYPGASIAVLAGWAIGLPTLQSSDTSYVVDWQRLFAKAWPDLPTTQIPIENVAFADEVVGAVHLHTAVSDVRQLSASAGTPSVSLAINGSVRAVVEAGEPLDFVWRTENVLGTATTWRTADLLCGSGETSGLWRTSGASGSYDAPPETFRSGCTYDIVVTGYSFNGLARDGVTVVVRESDTRSATAGNRQSLAW